MKPTKGDKAFACFIAGVVLAAVVFVLWSTQADCEARLAPDHRYCTD